MNLCAVVVMAVATNSAARPQERQYSLAANTRYEEVRTLRGAGYVNALAVSRNGELFALARDDGKVTLFHLASGEVIRTLEHPGAVYAVAFSPDSRVLATGGFDETIRLWELSGGREATRLQGHEGWVNAVAFTPDGRRLVSAGRDSTVRVWDVASGKILRVVADYPSEIFAVATSSDGQWLASDKGDSFCIRDVRTGREIADGAPGQWGINTLVFRPGSNELITSGYDGKIWAWGIAAGKVDHDEAITGGPVIAIAITTDGSLMAALCTGDRTVKLFDTRTWKQIGSLEGVSYPTGGVAFSGDGRWLAAGGGDSPVRVWRRQD
jgi:WD40 repeat protein